jgi:CHASE3 domain sensor protein
VDDERADLKAVAELGERVRGFKLTDVWRYLESRATEEIVASLDALKDVDAEDPKAIRQLQNRARVAELFLNWLDEAIQDGRNADEQLQLLNASD